MITLKAMAALPATVLTLTGPAMAARERWHQFS